MKKKVVHILNEVNFSGAEIMLRDAAKGFKNGGLDLYILSVQDKDGNFIQILEDSGYKVTCIKFRKSLGLFIDVFKFLRKEKIDIVHLHTERAFFYYALISKIAGINNIVRTVHNVFPFKGILKIRKYIERLIASKLIGVRFIVIGESVAEVERENYSIKTKIIRNWVDKNRFIPLNNIDEKQEIRSKLNINLNSTVLVSVGSCSIIKNHKALIRALAIVCNQVKKDIFYLHIGGGELHEEEKKLAKSLNLSQRVKFLGEVKNVREILVASDIFVMPSLHEGLSISLLEAMSCGLPSVVYNVYGLKDLIEDGVNGFLAQNTSESLATGILKLIENTDLREEMGYNAVQKIDTHYDMDTSINQLLEFYDYK